MIRLAYLRDNERTLLVKLCAEHGRDIVAKACGVDPVGLDRAITKRQVVHNSPLLRVSFREVDLCRELSRSSTEKPSLVGYVVVPIETTSLRGKPANESDARIRREWDHHNANLCGPGCPLKRRA